MIISEHFRRCATQIVGGLLTCVSIAFTNAPIASANMVYRAPESSLKTQAANSGAIVAGHILPQNSSVIDPARIQGQAFSINSDKIVTLDNNTKLPEGTYQVYNHSVNDTQLRAIGTDPQRVQAIHNAAFGHTLMHVNGEGRVTEFTPVQRGDMQGQTSVQNNMPSQINHTITATAPSETLPLSSGFAKTYSVLGNYLSNPQAYEGLKSGRIFKGRDDKGYLMTSEELDGQKHLHVREMRDDGAYRGFDVYQQGEHHHKNPVFIQTVGEQETSTVRLSPGQLAVAGYLYPFWPLMGLSGANASNYAPSSMAIAATNPTASAVAPVTAAAELQPFEETPIHESVGKHKLHAHQQHKPVIHHLAKAAAPPIHHKADICTTDMVKAMNRQADASEALVGETKKQTEIMAATLDLQKNKPVQVCSIDKNGAANSTQALNTPVAPPPAPTHNTAIGAMLLCLGMGAGYLLGRRRTTTPTPPHNDNPNGSGPKNLSPDPTQGDPLGTEVDDAALKPPSGKKKDADKTANSVRAALVANDEIPAALVRASQTSDIGNMSEQTSIKGKVGSHGRSVEIKKQESGDLHVDLSNGRLRLDIISREDGTYVIHASGAGLGRGTAPIQAIMDASGKLSIVQDSLGNRSEVRKANQAAQANPTNAEFILAAQEITNAVSQKAEKVITRALSQTATAILTLTSGSSISADAKERTSSRIIDIVPYLDQSRSRAARSMWGTQHATRSL